MLSSFKRIRNLLLGSPEMVIDLGDPDNQVIEDNGVPMGRGRGIDVLDPELLQAIRVRPAVRIFGPVLRAHQAEEEKMESQHSESLLHYVAGVRRENIDYETLANRFDPVELDLLCPIKISFPQIAVRFNDHIYDYDSLVALIENGYIKDPFTEEQIKIVPYVITPARDVQNKLRELNNKISQIVQHENPIRRP